MRKHIACVTALTLLAVSTALSLPRFASRTGFSCQSCHINPTGGGMRNTFGITYGREEITVERWQDQFALDEFSTKITDFLSYGLDFRFLAFYQRKDNPEATRSSFFPMQADVYLNLAISKRISVYANPAFGPYNRYEIFGLARILPATGYIKLGRFSPPHGFRVDDHTSFVREATPFRNNAGQQTGIEFGMSPGPVGITGAITNGITGDRDAELAKAVFGRLEVRAGLGPANLLAGGSTYNDVSGGEKLNILGGFAALSLFERLTLLGQVERIRGNSPFMSINADRNQRNAAQRDLKQLAIMVEANYQLIPGIDLKLMYDYFDPDTDSRSGKADRYSAGVEFMPLSGIEVRPLYRFTKDGILNRDVTDIHLLFHFYL